jgi:hypothetical protein
MLFLLENACCDRNYYFFRLTKAYHQSLALVTTLVSLFLGRFFASPHFDSICESVVVVRYPEHDRLGRPVFYGISKRTHLLSPLTPMIGIIGKQASRAVCSRGFIVEVSYVVGTGPQKT